MERISTDNNQVLLDGAPINNRKKEPLELDAQTFRCIGVGFFADTNGVYGLSYIRRSASDRIYLTKIRGHVDLESFESVSLYYAKDKERHYYARGGKTIRETQCELFFDRDDTWKNVSMEQKKFRAWISEFLLGQEHVYYKGRVLKGANPKTFTRIAQFYYADDRLFFERSNGQRINPIESVTINGVVQCLPNRG